MTMRPSASIVRAACSANAPTSPSAAIRSPRTATSSTCTPPGVTTDPPVTTKSYISGPSVRELDLLARGAGLPQEVPDVHGRCRRALDLDVERAEGVGDGVEDCGRGGDRAGFA